MHRLLVFGAAGLAALALSGSAAAWSWPADGDVLRPFALGGNAYAAGQHRGIDVAGPDGSPVRAPASGTVSFAGSLPTHGRGVTIVTADGYSVTLVHLGTIGVVKGNFVAEGSPVGTMGSSGEPEHSVPSVHLGVRIAAQSEGYVDPISLLPVRSEAPASPPSPAPAPAPAAAPGPASGPAPVSAPAPVVVPAPTPALVPVPESPAVSVAPVAAAPPVGSQAGNGVPESAAPSTTPSRPAVVSPHAGIGSTTQATSPARSVPARDRFEPGRSSFRLAPGAPTARGAASDGVSTSAGHRSGAHVAPWRLVPSSAALRPGTRGADADSGTPSTPRTANSSVPRLRGGGESVDAVLPTTEAAPVRVQVQAPGARREARGATPPDGVATATEAAPRATRAVLAEATAAVPGERAAATRRSGRIVEGAATGLATKPVLAAIALLVVIAAGAAARTARRIGGDGAVLRHHADLLRQLHAPHRARIHDRGGGRLHTPSAAARP